MRVVLADIAGRAGVSVQTVLRHFGSRDGLFAVVVETGSREIAAERETPPGDLAAAVRTIVAHYEKRGDFVIRMLAREDADRIRATSPRAASPSIATGWRPPSGRSSASAIPPGTRSSSTCSSSRTDVYTWKLLRRDRGLGAGEVEARTRTLVEAILAVPD